ncbi:MAG: hypothetical protein J7M05_14530 [Anaerolineae bacterium]|nr:hypothetical protein [Anaerolineae bacterium]
MSGTNPIQEIIRTAIQREIDAYNLYHSAAAKAESQTAKGLLEELAAQEKGHRAKLEALLKGEALERLGAARQKKVEVPLEADSSL